MSYCIVILDACRYDVFEEVYRSYLDGRLYGLRVPYSCTIEFLRGEFTGYYDLTYVSANGFVLGREVCTKRFGCFDGSKHFSRIVECFLHGWSNDAGTVPPEHVTACGVTHRYPRMIVHYIQPHAPYLGGRLRRLNERQLTEMLRRGEVSAEEVREAYTKSLERALENVARLIDRMDHEVVVVTSDHGELLGEMGLVDHPCGMRHEVLNTVPWLVVRGGAVD